MKVYLNQNRMEELESISNMKELLQEIYSLLDEEILKDICINGDKVKEEDFHQNKYSLEEIDTLEIKTEKVNSLIKDTLEEAQNYLPKLIEGFTDVATLFRQGKEEEANIKYELCLEGLDWYLDILKKILSLINNEELSKEGIGMLNKFNEFTGELVGAFEDQDLIFVADLLEYEIIGFLEDFKQFNKKLLENI